MNESKQSERKKRTFLHSITRPTKSGEKYITKRVGKHGTAYTVRIQSQGVTKSFKTLDEAIKQRDEWINQFHNFGQIIQNNRTPTSLTFDDQQKLWEYIVKKIAS